MVKSKLFAVFVTLMMLMVSGTFSVYAEDDSALEEIITDEGSVISEEPTIAENISDNNVLTIDCHDDKTPLSGMDWNIYKVAEIDQYNTYTVNDTFSKYNVGLNNLTTSQTVAAAEALEAYAIVDGIAPLSSGTTNSEGIIEFENLSYGLYLLCGSDVTVNEKFYLPTPSLVVLNNESEKDGSHWRYNVTTMPKLKVLAATNRVYRFSATVKKEWENDDEATRPKSVTVSLIKDGEKFSTVTLSDENNWTHTWNKLSTKYKWTVIEEDTFDNYSVIYSEKDININPDDSKQHDVEYLIVNRGNVTPKVVAGAKAEKQPIVLSKKLPQTGQLWWPVPTMSAIGLAVFAIGWKVNSHKRKKYEK